MMLEQEFEASPSLEPGGIAGWDAGAQTSGSQSRVSALWRRCRETLMKSEARPWEKCVKLCHSGFYHFEHGHVGIAHKK